MKKILSKIAYLIWIISERLNIRLGKFTPKIFDLMLMQKGKKITK